MESIGASKTSLSSITTEELWKQSGRYSANSELLRLKDRKDSGFLLSPTHEEEVTALVASVVHSYKDLPLRLYQTGRKYRDERRPRQGLLRAKEFMMKDLYTFDATVEAGLETYKSVREAYKNLFDELKLPYLVADADSGNMGGKLSHEYHFVSPKGEDNVWSCDGCSYVANEELVEKKPPEAAPTDSPPLTFTGISVDRTTAIEIHVPRPSHLDPSYLPTWSDLSTYTNPHALKKALPANLELDTGIEASTLPTLLAKTTQTTTLTDRTLSSSSTDKDLTPTLPGAHCPNCTSGTLSVQKAIEVAHTFHLGTRYSVPLRANISIPSLPSSSSSPSSSPSKHAKDTKTTWAPMQMGCHGIGVSRLIGAIASLLADGKGLQWPRVVAPFEVAVLTNLQSTNNEGNGEGEGIYDVLTTSSKDLGAEGVKQGAVQGIDVVLDDRPKSLGWKLKDAELIGYPVVVVLGKKWKERGEVEVQCRRLGFREDVGVGDLRGVVGGLLGRL